MTSGSEESEFVCWLLDTRTLWPDHNNINDAAKGLLGLVDARQQESIRQKLQMRDAKMSLGSELLKRTFVRWCGRGWGEGRFERDRLPGEGRGGRGKALGKPRWVSGEDDEQQQKKGEKGRSVKFDFNVSHQAGIVVLLGWRGKTNEQHGNDDDNGQRVEVGVDVVCVNERNDYRAMDKMTGSNGCGGGFCGWVDMHGQFFSAAEVEDMKYGDGGGFLLPVYCDSDSDGAVKTAPPVTSMVVHATDIQVDGSDGGGGAHGCCRDTSRNPGQRCGCHGCRRGRMLSVRPRPCTTDDTIITSNTNKTTATDRGQLQKERLWIRSEDLVAAKLRRFYAFFAYKEAYLKLTGHGMLAPWLQHLEFRNVRAPQIQIPPTTSTSTTKREMPGWGELLTESHAAIPFLHGARVPDVRLRLQAYEQDFMIAMAWSASPASHLSSVPPLFTVLDLESDILPLAL